MVLSREVYQVLEDIVGPENISDDPALLDSYRYPLTHTAIHLGPYYRKYTPRGAAVLLPGSTEEIQAIVKVCNKHTIKFKASSTFWSAMGYPSYDNTIQLDMRRMDKILEIDEKNMFAVIEPYAIGAVLQAEAMKKGLNCHIHGSGSSCSLLASATSFVGPGPDGLFLGLANENMLGIEWVMPNGEVVRTGSLGSGLGWFCGEGPGPGIRSIIRGFQGAMGSMGVFTKIALKLHPWPGPSQLPVEGIPPAYRTTLPDNFRVYTLAFKTWQGWSDGCYMIWDAGIGYIAHRQFNMFGRDLKGAMIKILTDPTKTLSDMEELLKDPKVQKMTEAMQRDFQIVLAGMTQRDIEWQDKALDKILAETGGYKVEEMNEPEIRDWALLYLIRLGHKNLNLVYGGGYDGCFGMVGPPDFGASHIEEVSDFKREWEKKGAIVAAGGDCTMGGIGYMGGGGITMWENFTHFDPSDRDSTEGTCEFFDASYRYGVEHGLGYSLERLMSFARGADGMATSDEEKERWLAGAPQAFMFQYQRQIKELLDPNDLGDQTYRWLKPPKKKKGQDYF
jgi:glycolate oxidase